MLLIDKKPGSLNVCTFTQGKCFLAIFVLSWKENGKLIQNEARSREEKKASLFPPKPQTTWINGNEDAKSIYKSPCVKTRNCIRENSATN